MKNLLSQSASVVDTITTDQLETELHLDSIEEGIRNGTLEIVFDENDMCDLQPVD